MKKRFRTLLLSLSLFLFLYKSSSAQITEPSYILTFLKGKYLDSTKQKEIILIFKHVSKSQTIEKLIISGKLTYNLNPDSLDKSEVLGRGPNHHTITVLGNEENEENKYFFSLIKNNPGHSTEKYTRYIAFTLRNLTDKYISKMTFTYGLWEPADENIRLETKYQITIDK